MSIKRHTHQLQVAAPHVHTVQLSDCLSHVVLVAQEDECLARVLVVAHLEDDVTLGDAKLLEEFANFLLGGRVGQASNFDNSSLVGFLDE